MAIWQAESVRMNSGGRRIRSHKKRRFEIGREPHPTGLGETKRKTVRVRAAATKTRLLQGNVAYVTDPKTGTTKKSEIKTVAENAANPNYVRRNILTKGAIIVTGLGKARVTSRPGQRGVISAVLVGK
jgi:small subunit ribosomal protein S8e